VTYAQLRTRIAQILGLAGGTAENSEEWTMTGDVVNQAVVDLLSRTRINVRCAQVVLTANERLYELADQVLRAHYLRYPTGEEILQVAPSDITRSGGGTFSVVGHNGFRLGWDPGSNGQGMTLSFDYTPYPAPMSQDTDDPSLAQFGNVPDEFHPALIDYSCWMLADYAKDAASGRGEVYRTRYEGKAGIGEPGSWIGRIRMDTNLRFTGVHHGRMRSGQEQLVGDTTPDYWVG